MRVFVRVEGEGRIGEDKIESARLRVGDKRRHVLAAHRAVEFGAREIGADGCDRFAMTVDEDARDGPAAQGFDAERAAARRATGMEDAP